MTRYIKQLLTIAFLLHIVATHAQQVPVAISGGRIHVGDGTVIENGLVIIQNGSIQYAGPMKESGYDANTASLIDATGKDIYPGFIGMGSTIGLNEITAVRSTRDAYEVGVYNPNIRSLIAYNTDSKVIPTVRTNGVLLAQVVPYGGVIGGQSSVFKMSGWNWEDAAIATDDNMHMPWPSVYNYDYEKNTYGPNAQYRSEVEDIYTFFAEARSYCNGNAPRERNLRFEAMRKVLNGKQKLFISANSAKQIIGAVALSDSFHIKIVIRGGRQSYRVTELLKERNIPVLLEATHELPSYDGDPVDLPYKLPAMLHDAGIMCGLSVCNEGDSYWNLRNLPFQAGTAAAYGLNREEALKMITLNNAMLAGIDEKYGTIKTGKSATLFISDGDALDMGTNRLSIMFIAGERLKPDNWQSELSNKYELKYNIQIHR